MKANHIRLPISLGKTITVDSEYPNDYRKASHDVG